MPADHQYGNLHRRTVFLVTCPGQNEEIEGRPLSPNGASGQSAREFLVLLNQVNRVEFPSPNIDDYTILNAHHEPRWKPLGQLGYFRTRPTDRILRAPENLVRLRRVLAEVNVEKVLLMGVPAAFVWHLVNNDFPAALVHGGLPHPQNPNGPGTGSRIGNWRVWAEPFRMEQ